MESAGQEIGTTSVETGEGSSSGKRKRYPDTVEHFKITWENPQPPFNTKSIVFNYVVAVYSLPANTALGGKAGNVQKLQADHHLYLLPFADHMVVARPNDAPGNIQKHMEILAQNPAVPIETQKEVALALVHIKKNPKGGLSASHRIDAGDGTNPGMGFVKKTTGYKKDFDCRANYMRIALLGAGHHLPYNALASPFMHDVLHGMDPRHAQISREGIQNHQYALYSFLKREHVERFKVLMAFYDGFPFASVSTDMWTTRHKNEAYSSMVVRVSDPTMPVMEVFNLGIVKFNGKHTAAAIKEHLKIRLNEFGLSFDCHILSIATDSGANVKRCCLDLKEENGLDWMPCILHGLHNSCKYAFGLVDENVTVDDDETIQDIVFSSTDQ